MKALNNILKGFQKVVQQLEDLAKRNHDQADLKVEQAEALDDQANALGDEAKATEKAATNIRGLLEGILKGFTNGHPTDCEFFMSNPRRQSNEFNQ